MMHAQDIWAWRAAADRAGWTLRYARINVLALRKILKKYDKLMQSQFGQELLQVSTAAHDSQWLALLCMAACRQVLSAQSPQQDPFHAQHHTTPYIIAGSMDPARLR